CTRRAPPNPFLDGGIRGAGDACSRDAQCQSPLRCVAFVCGELPDANFPDAAMADSGPTDAATPDTSMPDAAMDLDAADAAVLLDAGLDGGPEDAASVDAANPGG